MSGPVIQLTGDFRTLHSKSMSMVFPMGVEHDGVEDGKEDGGILQCIYVNLPTCTF